MTFARQPQSRYTRWTKFIDCVTPMYHVGIEHITVSRANHLQTPIASGLILGPEPSADRPMARPADPGGRLRRQPLLVVHPVLQQLLEQHQDLVTDRQQRLLL